MSKALVSVIDGRGLARSIRGPAVGDGTPAYSVSARSDVYTFGLVLYELFTGERAWLNHVVHTAGGIVSYPLSSLFRYRAEKRAR